MYLSFLQGGLEFRFLLLNLLLDFLQLMNRLSSLCNLLREVGNLLCGNKHQWHGQAQSTTGRALSHQGDRHPCPPAGTDPCAVVRSAGQEKALPGAEGRALTLQVLVLPLQRFQVVQGLLIGILHLKELRAERASLLLGGFQLSLCLLVLLLPFCQDLKRNQV